MPRDSSCSTRSRPALADFGSAPFSFADLDAVVRPDDVLAMEIYASGQVPPALGMGMTGCGAIAVWTR